MNLFPAGSSASARQSVFNMPAVVSICIAVFIIIHVVRSVLLSSEFDSWLLLSLSFIPARYADGFVGFSQLDGWGIGVWSWVTYSLLHYDVMHLLVNCLYFAIFGSAVARFIGWKCFLLLYIVSSIGGALSCLLVRWGDIVLVIGASSTVSGMMGAIISSICYAGDDDHILSSADSSSQRTLLIFVMICFLISLLPDFASMSMLFGTEKMRVAWEAHLGGFVAGFIFSAYLLRK